MVKPVIYLVFFLSDIQYIFFYIQFENLTKSFEKYFHSVGLYFFIKIMVVKFE